MRVCAPVLLIGGLVLFAVRMVRAQETDLPRERALATIKKLEGTAQLLPPCCKSCKNCDCCCCAGASCSRCPLTPPFTTAVVPVRLIGHEWSWITSLTISGERDGHFLRSSASCASPTHRRQA